MIKISCNKQIEFTEESLKEGANFTKEGIHDPEVLERVNNILETFLDNDVFIDVGAHIGTFSLLLNKGKAYAFEPTKKTFKHLKDNIKLNNKNIIIINQAVSNSIFNYVVLTGQHSGLNIIAEGESENKTTTLDSFPFEGNIKLIKIDVEGHEEYVITGAINLLKKYKPIVIYEFKGLIGAKIKRRLEEIGYFVEDLNSENKIAIWQK